MHQAKYMNVPKVSMCKRTCVYAHAVPEREPETEYHNFIKIYLIYVWTRVSFSTPAST